MNGFKCSKQEYRGNVLRKRFIASLSAVALAMGLCLTGLLVAPLTAKADSYPNPTINESDYNSEVIVGNSSEWTYVKIPVVVHVNNMTTPSNGQYAYVPCINLMLVCKPVTSTNEYKTYFPSNKNYKENHPSINGRTWIGGEVGCLPEEEHPQFDTNYKYTIDGIYKYNDESVHPIAWSEIAFQDDWFTGLNGTYRYQLFMYEPVFGSGQGSIYPTFQIANMDTSGNRMFVDMYVESGKVKAVILVDEDNNKLEAVGDAPDPEQETTEVTPEVGGGNGSIIYNVVDVNISNTILGDNTNGYTYAGNAATNSMVICWPSKLNAVNADDVVVTSEWKENGFKHDISLTYTPNKDTKGFDYTLINFPVGWNLTMAQTTQVDVEGTLQVYEKNTSRWTNYSTSPLDWINTIAEANDYTRIRNQDVTLTSVSVSNNKIGFVNAILESIPVTGIALQVLPFILMAAGAGVLLLFVMKRRTV